ncbi:MAG TPA: hypothetical protein VIV60_24590 [Polyangiaceae bacterium]
MKLSGFLCAVVGTLFLSSACASGGDITDALAANAGNRTKANTGGQLSVSGGESSATSATDGGDESGGTSQSSRTSAIGVRGGSSNTTDTSVATGGRRMGAGGSSDPSGGSAESGAGGTGADATGGRLASGGVRNTGGARSSSIPSFGSSMSGGGRSNSTATGLAGSVSTSGGAPGACDFKSTACPDVCSTLAEWEMTHCTALLTCLDSHQSCITKADPLCSTKDPNKNPICTDYYNLSTQASKDAVAAHVACLCGL